MNNEQHPARRLRHGDRPTEPLSWDESASQLQAAAPSESLGFSADDAARLEQYGPEAAISQKNAIIKAHQAVLAERDATIADLRAQLARQHATPSDLQQIKALALAWTKNSWYGGFQVADGITNEEAIRFIVSASPAVVLDLIARIESAAAPALTGWQTIETAPKDGSEVLLYLGAPWSRVEKARWFSEWANWQEGEFPTANDEFCGIGSDVPTHWMPVPGWPGGAASPATASGDELPKTWQARQSESGYNRNAEACMLDEITELRAAVSAATKPTADLKLHNRIAQRLAWLQNGATSGEVNMPEFFADVQSLLATKPAAAQADQSIIGKLLDGFSEIEHLWGLNEPGALVRHRDVFNLIVAVGKAAAAPAAPMAQEQQDLHVMPTTTDDEWPTPADLLAENLDNIAEQWTECMYDAPGGEIDIGASLRVEFAKLNLAAAPMASTDAVIEAREQAIADCLAECEAVRESGCESKQGAIECIEAISGLSAPASQPTKGGSQDAELRAAVQPPLYDKDPTNIQY